MIEKAVCDMICDAIFEVMKSVLFPGHNVMLKGKGTFFLKGQHVKQRGRQYGKEVLKTVKIKKIT